MTRETREMDAVEHSLDVPRTNRQGRTPQMCATLFLLSIPMRALNALQRVFLLGGLNCRKLC